MIHERGTAHARVRASTQSKSKQLQRAPSTLTRRPGHETTAPGHGVGAREALPAAVHGCCYLEERQDARVATLDKTLRDQPEGLLRLDQRVVTVLLAHRGSTCVPALAV